MDGRELNTMIADYRERFALDDHLAFYRTAPDIGEAIERSAMAYIGHKKRHADEWKRHPHQYRLPGDVLRSVCNNIKQQVETLGRAQSFEEILALVRSSRVPGFGELAIYDTALRLAAFRQRMPTTVYLHAGTRKGAAVLGLPTNGEVLRMDQLPEPLRALEPHQVEDFLCIYKEHLSPVVEAPRPVKGCLPGAVDEVPVEPKGCAPAQAPQVELVQPKGC